MSQVPMRIAVTLIDLTALAALIGSAWCLFWMMPPADDQEPRPAFFSVRLRLLLMICLTALVISSIAGLAQRSIEMSGVGITSILPVLPTVLFKTHYGSMWFVRMAGLAAAWLSLLGWRRQIDSRLFGIFLLIAGSIIAFSRSASGHPADFGDLSPQQLVDWLHLFAASSWGGVLLSLAVIFPPSLARDGNLPHHFLAGIADRFYAIFGPVLAIIVFAGVFNAAAEMGSFQALVVTPYGRLLLAKLILFLILALRYIAPPAHGQDEARFAMKFLGRTRVEAVIVIGVLFCVSWIVQEVPSRHSLHLAHAQGGGHATHDAHMHPAQGLKPIVELEITPERVGAGIPVQMTVHLKDQNGKSLTGLEVSHDRILHAIIISRDLNIFAHIHPEDIGPVSDEMLMKAALPLQFTFPKAGEYLIGIDFGASGNLYSKSFPVKVAGAPAMGGPKIDFSTKKNYGDYRINLTISPKEVRAGAETKLSYVIEKNRKAVTDFAPYLGAAMHLAIVPVDLKLFIHAHGVTPEEPHSPIGHMHAAPPGRFGPEIEADVVFPVAGIYKVFSQVNHQGKVLLFDFMVRVQ
jgi:putative copper export protein